ncbi:MAG: tetratricopeptide repeat protein, partial [Chloroflexota bacterium]|nr:tetratricopeptide repeat protein [Chloroflexota bacterium]
MTREDVRLLTLHGPPGIGKTKLGVQAGYDLLPCFPDGVFFVPLADVTDPRMMVPEIARLLQLVETPDRPPAGALKDYLYNKRALLILDNFEQLLAAAPMVSDLLSACPSIKVLVTSRGVLHIAGEIELRVSALSLPRPNVDVDKESASRYESVQLFVQRASAADIGFQLTDDSASVVVEICRRLDALPLAIELAAAWCRVLTPGDIAARVADGLKLLSSGDPDLPARQQTLGSAIDWSYELLGPAEALLFHRMAVFSGGATVDAVEAVCMDGDGDQALKLLTALLDAGLLQRAGDRNGASRFTMLTTIRKYADDKLRASGEADDISYRHAMYYFSQASVPETVLTTGHRQAWLDRMEAEHENLRAALAWCLSEAQDQYNHNGADIGIRMAAALGWFWYFRGYFTEGRHWLDQATRRASSQSDASPDVMARAFNSFARLAWRQSDYPTVLSAATRSLELARACGDTVETAHALTMLGITLVRQNNVTGGYLLLEDAVAKFRQSKDEWGLAFGLDHLADATTWRGDYDTATRLYQESLGLFSKLKDLAGVAAELRELGNIALQLKDYGEAVANLEQVLSLDTPAVGQWDRAHSLYSLAYAYQAMHETERSAKLYNQALALFRELGVRLGVAGALRNLGYLAMDGGDRRAALDLYAQYLDHAQDLNNEYSTLICLAAVAGLLCKCERNEAAIQL